MIDKNSIYQQIRLFNIAPSNPNVANSTLMADAYLFVKDLVAIDSAKFLTFLMENESTLKGTDWSNLTVLDMAYGSGNLTSHLVLENFNDIDKILFNDKNVDANNRLEKVYPKDKVEFFKRDFLNEKEWIETQKADVIVFNPQIGGAYTKGDAGFEKIVPLISELSFEEYLNEKGIETDKMTINDYPLRHKIVVYSEELTKSQLSTLLKDIKIFNYHDVFYQSKNSKEEGNETNIVKFRATFDKVFSSDGWLIFLGSPEYFKYLFSDFNTVFDYWASGAKTGQHLFVAAKADTPLSICYEKSGNDYVEIPNCEKGSTVVKADGDLDTLENEIEKLFQDLDAEKNEEQIFTKPQTENIAEQMEKTEQPKTKKTPFILRGDKFGNIDFAYKNILLKGVPGTGKSRLINESFIKKQLGFPKITHPNILRINIHSASSNADLMQGIGISSPKGQIEYHEKQGLILHHLKEAIAKPYEPFVIVLEEIQENSLNELIGDLIYLIEDEKRVNIRAFIEEGLFAIDQSFESIDTFLNELIDLKDTLHFVEIPYLVSNETLYRKLIIPDNLYFFCTSNYRDDKKIVEDNLLRRFELIEIYPKYENVIKNKDVAAFLKDLNESIIKHFNKKEIHPDRFMIGHAVWIDVNNEATFCRALLKAITEFKDIREIEFSDIEPVLKDLKTLPFDVKPEILRGGYKTIIDTLQTKAYGDILNA